MIRDPPCNTKNHMCVFVCVCVCVGGGGGVDFVLSCLT